MSLAFRCERCGKDFTAGSEWAGRRGKCKQCGHVFRIPAGPAGGSSASASRPAGEGARSRAARTTPAQAAQAAPVPWSFARDGDPYGINDEPLPKQAPSQDPDIDELLPQRARPTSKPKKRRNGSKSDQASFPFWVLLVGALSGLVLARAVWLYRPPGMHPGWIVLAFTGYTLSFSGVLACLSVAFREGVVHGFCCLFAPFYIFYYVVSRWVDTKEGFALAGLGSILLAVVNSLQPALIENFKHRSRLGVAGNPRQFQHFAQPGMPRHPFPGPGNPHVQNVPPPGVVPPGGPTRRNEPAPATPAPPEVVPLDFTEQVLADLKSPKLHTRKHALDRLNDAPANDRRAEVAKAVEPLLKDPDGFCRSDAARVLGGGWGGPENVPALLEGLKDPDFGVRWSVLDALTARHDPASAEGIVEYMLSFNDRSKAIEALKAIGPPAEDAVLLGLSHHDGFTRMDVCKILQEIGTRKSIVPLQRFLRRGSDHGLDVMAANDALRQIAYRTRNSR